MKKKEAVLNLKDITFSYAVDENTVLDNINFALSSGEKIGIIGPNGSGKSTLLHLIMGLLTPSSGSITIFGKIMKSEKDFSLVRKKIGFVFQDADDQLFSPTVLEDIAFGPLNLGFEPDDARKLAQETLKKLGLEGFEDRVTYKLSGGEKKLIAIATVLVMKPDILILDEPTTGLDTETIEKVAAILNKLDVALLVVSHRHDFLEKVVHSKVNFQDLGRS